MKKLTLIVLSFFEIQGMCEKYDAPSTSTYHYIISREIDILGMMRCCVCVKFT